MTSPVQVVTTASTTTARRGVRKSKAPLLTCHSVACSRRVGSAFAVWPGVTFSCSPPGCVDGATSHSRTSLCINASAHKQRVKQSNSHSNNIMPSQTFVMHIPVHRSKYCWNFASLRYNSSVYKGQQLVMSTPRSLHICNQQHSYIIIN